METTQTLGSATLNVSICTGYGGDIVGQSFWRLKTEDFEKIKSTFRIEDSRMYEGPEEVWDDDEEAEEWSTFSNVDAGILILACMGKLGGTFEIEWCGETEYWFFHDLDHAEYDTWIGGPGTCPDFSVESQSEERALANGARRAIIAGVDIDEVCNEMAQIIPDFNERFGYAPGNLWSTIFDGAEIKLPE